MFSKAEAYERFMGRWSRLLAPPLVAFAGVREGDDVLDVGSGTGALAFALSAASVRGVDPSPDFVAHAARQNARARFEVGDAQQLPFPSATFDKTLSLLVINFVADRERALNEMIRVTKPQGVVAAAVWDYGEGMQMLRAFWDEAVALDPAIAPRDEARMPLCEKGQLGEQWRRVGLQAVEETELEVALRFASFDDYWQPFLLGQGPAGAHVASLSDERRALLEARLRRRLGGDQPLEMRARAWAVRGIA